MSAPDYRRVALLLREHRAAGRSVHTVEIRHPAEKITPTPAAAERRGGEEA